MYCVPEPRKEKNRKWGHGRLKQGVSVERKPMPYTIVTSDSLWSDILEFAKLKYQFDLPVNARSRVKKISVIRNFCQKVGLAVTSRKYDLAAALPFNPSDIINLQPVVKHSIHVCSVAKDLVETGKIQLAEGMLGEAYSLFSEAFMILQQVTGPMHKEVANCYRYVHDTDDYALSILCRKRMMIRVLWVLGW